MDPAPPSSKLRRLGRTRNYLILIFVLGTLLAVLFMPTRNESIPVNRSTDGNNLRALGLAWIAYEKDHPEGLPPEALTGVYAFAAHLARIESELNQSYWISPIDPVWLLGTKKPTAILGSAPDGLTKPIHPDFQQAPLAVAVVLLPKITQLTPDTPIAWTRGLQADGIWRADSPYGGIGGFVFFAGGFLQFFHEIDGKLIKWDRQKTTSNIVEALPPGTRISEYVPPPGVLSAMRWAKWRAEFLHGSTVLFALAMAFLCAMTAANPRNEWGGWFLPVVAGSFCVLCFWFLLFG